MLSLCVKLLCKEAGGAGGGEGARDTESKTTRRTGNRSHKTHVFFFKMWFYHSAVLIWWLEILEKLGARFLAFQRHRCNACVATCHVVSDPRDLSSVATCNVANDPRDLSSMAIYHVRSTRNVNMPPHPTPPHPTPTHTRDLSSVATCHVVNDPRDLSSMAIYHVRSKRNVNMPPHPTPPHPNPQSRYSKTRVLRERFSVRRQKQEPHTKLWGKKIKRLKWSAGTCSKAGWISDGWVRYREEIQESNTVLFNQAIMKHEWIPSARANTDPLSLPARWCLCFRPGCDDW